MNRQTEIAGTSFASIVHDKPEAHREVSAEPSILRAYLAIIYRRKWTLILCVALALVVGIVLTLVATRQYTATTVLEITRDSNRVFEVEGQRTESTLADAAFYETQYNLLRSRTLADRVIRELNLRQDVIFARNFGLDEATGADGADTPFLAEVTGQTNPQQAERQRIIRETLLDNLSIRPVRNSQLVEVGFTSPDPELSARVAQSWGENFIAEQIERKIGESSFARNYLEERLRTLRNALEVAERRSVEFANENNIVTIQAESPDGRALGGRLLVEDTVAELNRDLSEAISERLQAQAAYNEQASGSGASALTLTSQVVSSLRARRAQLSAEYERMLTQFEPAYPPAQAMRGELAELDSAIRAEEQRIQDGATRELAAAYRAATQREERVRELLQTVQQDLNIAKSDNIEYNILRRDADQNRQLYDAVLQRYMEIGVAGGVGPTNISIVDAAEAPDRPSAPSPALNMLLALAIGLGIGIAVVVAQEQLDDKIKDPDDLERQLRLPPLGVIPREEVDDYEHLMAELRDPKSKFSESILALQASLSFASSEGIPRSLTFTSTQPAEGKSITCTALATRLALGGYRTLLIDGDMRSPSVNKLLGMPNERGFSNALSGEDNLEALIHRTEWANLDTMLAGPQPPNAAELLASNRLSDLLERLGQTYDKILIDAPPVIGLADTLLISSAVAGTIYVVAANQTSSNRARISLRRLGASDANLLGVILTKYDASSSYSYGYGYDYGYGYGRDAS